jgi:hypothetical protein
MHKKVFMEQQAQTAATVYKSYQEKSPKEKLE